MKIYSLRLSKYLARYCPTETGFLSREMTWPSSKFCPDYCVGSYETADVPLAVPASDDRVLPQVELEI